MTDAASRWRAAEPLAAAFAEAVIPRDEWPSAWDAGAGDFLSGVLLGERVADLPRALAALETVDAAIPGGFAPADSPAREAAVERLAGDPDVAWLIRLVALGFYADPGNKGNRDAVSWRSLAYDPVPAGDWSPSAVEQPPASTTLGTVADRYDVIVVGSGAGGGAAAAVLAESGRRVLIVERGSWPDPLALWSDHLRNARAEVGFDPLTGPPTPGNPRLLELDDLTAVPPTDPRWGNNAMTAGGGTRVYGAQAWRFSPDDFRMATRYGVPDGSSLADWPVGYDELEPFYARAEQELGVSGATGGDRAAGPRSGPFPMPPIESTASAAVLRRGAELLGLTTGPVPLLVNSVEHGGRPACVRCGACIGFPCPIGAKAGSHNTMLRRALATGRADLLLATRVTRITTDPRGRVDGVELVSEDDPSLRRRIAAGQVVVAAGAVESARLLLASSSAREPDGLGNNTDQVGRHLQGHIYGGALALFDDPLVDLRGPGPAIATGDFRHGNPGLIGGGLLANEFVPTPVSAYAYLTDLGVIPAFGAAGKAAFRHAWPRLQRVMGPVHEMTSAESRVRLAGTGVDAAGMPLVRVSGASHPEDLRVQAFLSERAEEWLRASGATRVARVRTRGTGMGPSSGAHQAGTCRMGEDPASSVTDPDGRVWGHDNLVIADASVHVTNSGVNPVLTIFANALRIASRMVD